MKLFKFGKLSKYHLYCLALPIFTFVKSILRNLSEDDKKENFILFDTVLTSFCIFFGGCFDCFFKFISCSNNDHQKKKNNNRSFQNPTKTGNKIVSLPKEPDVKEKEEKIYFVLFCLIISILDICVSIGYFIISSYDTDNNIEFLRTFQVVFVSIITKLLYEHQIFWHRVLGFSFIFVGLLLVSLRAFIKMNDIFSVILGLSVIGLDLILAVEGVFSKWIMEKYSVLPLKFMIWFGFFETLLSSTLFLIPFCIRNCKSNFCKQLLINTSLEKIFGEGVWKGKVIYKIIHFFCLLVYNLIYFYLIYFLTPNHICISDTISVLFFWILSVYSKIKIQSYNILWIASQIIGNILCLIGCSIYNELIILKFCGLDTYCRESITIRGANEIEDIEEIGVNTNSPVESLVS